MIHFFEATDESISLFIETDDLNLTDPARYVSLWFWLHYGEQGNIS